MSNDGPELPNITPGQLWVVQGPCEELGQLAMVARCGRDHVAVALCHTYVEYAVASDTIIGRGRSGLSFDVVVCARLVGVAPRGWLARLVCDLGEAIASEIMTEAPESEGRWCGTALGAAPFDARGVFRAELVRVSWRLAHDVLEHLWGSDEPKGPHGWHVWSTRQAGDVVAS